MFDLKDRKGFVTRPRNVAARRDYNRIEIEGQDPNVVESKLAELEALGDQAFRRIIAARSIEDRDDFSFVHVLIARIAISNPAFRDQRDQIISQVARIAISNPAFRDQRDQIISQVGSMMMRNMVATPEQWDAVTGQMGPELGGDPIPYEQARTAVEGGSIVANATKETLIEQEILLWPLILPTLEQRKWTLLIAPPGSAGFITSDRPFSLQWNDETMNRGPYGVGLGCTDTTLIFPISHNLAVIGSFEHGGGANVVDESIVAAVNFALFQAAMRQVYASADFPITDVGKVVRPFSQSEVWRRVRERSADPS